MSAMESQITNLTIVYSSIHSGADQRKHQSSASLDFVRGIHRWPMNSPHKGQLKRKMFPFDDVIMNDTEAALWWTSMRDVSQPGPAELTLLTWHHNSCTMTCWLCPRMSTTPSFPYSTANNNIKLHTVGAIAGVGRRSALNYQKHPIFAVAERCNVFVFCTKMKMM